MKSLLSFIGSSLLFVSFNIHAQDVDMSVMQKIREEGLQKITDFIKQGYMTPVAANAIPKIFNLFYPVAKPQDKEEKSIIVTFDGE